MPIRPVTPADLPALAELYRSSVGGLGPQAYTPDQIAAWISWPDDAAEFNARLQQGLALVSTTDAGEPAAFAQLHPADYVSLLYTGARFARQGHATALYARLEQAARGQHVPRLHTIASHLSKPFFGKHGFKVFDIELRPFKGAVFERFLMEKHLSAHA